MLHILTIQFSFLLILCNVNNAKKLITYAPLEVDVQLCSTFLLV